MKCIRVLLVVAAMLFGAISAHAQPVSGQGTWESTLQARDIGNTGTTNAFYDTSLNITWLANANVNGQMDWNTAGSWANNLTVGGIGGWRLPTIADPNADNYASYSGGSAGWNVNPASSEMAHLFFSTLGDKSYYDTNGAPQAGAGLSNTANFQNMQSAYWLGTEFAYNSIAAWDFKPIYGLQIAEAKSGLLYAMAVHSGDVGAVVSAVPEPEAYAMLLAGLGLVGAVVRRRRSIDTSGVTPCQL